MHFDLREIAYNISMIFLIVIGSFMLTKWVGSKFSNDEKEEE